MDNCANCGKTFKGYGPPSELWYIRDKPTSPYWLECEECGVIIVPKKQVDQFKGLSKGIEENCLKQFKSNQPWAVRQVLRFFGREA